MRNPHLNNGQFYHVYNRGVNKRPIFQSDVDYERFVQSMIVFNEQNRISTRALKVMKIRPEPSPKPFVKLHAFALMPNHFHFLLEQCTEYGISEFMGRLSNGYTKYFNIKQKRTDSLFGCSFKSKVIQDTNHLHHVSRYIHLNPLELLEPTWKEKGVQSWKKAKEYLEKYKWSSLPSYLNNENMPFVESSFILNDFDSAEDYLKYLQDWVVDRTLADL